MKKKTFLSRGKFGSLVVLAIGGLAFASCADHYDGDESWSSPVSNKEHLDSPTKEGIKITASADGSTFDISWPVVYGAGGYEVKLVDITDQALPVTIYEGNVDGCSRSAKREEDSNYKLSVRSLGNSSLNNGEALVATDSTFTTFVARIDEIPANSDLAEYFTAKLAELNPEVEGHAEVLPFDVVPGATYTLNDAIDFQGYRVLIRSTSKTRNANLIIGENGRFDITAGFSLRGLDIDMTATNNPLIKGSSNPLDSIKGRTTWNESGSYGSKRIICEPVRVQRCNIKAMKAALIDMSAEEYYLKDFIMADSRIQTEPTATQVAIIKMTSKSYINDFKAENCTVWNTGEANYSYFMQYANAGRCPDMDLTSMSSTMTNCTFYNIAKTGQWANYSNFAGAKRNMTTITYTDNIFVDCGNKQLMRRVLGGQKTGWGKLKTNQNTYWFDGEDISATEGEYDTGKILTTDPAFVDPANGDFTPTGAEQVSFKTGDTYWFNK